MTLHHWPPQICGRPCKDPEIESDRCFDSNMDTVLYDTILDYKTKGQYPANITKAEKNEVRRKASKFVVEGELRISVLYIDFTRLCFFLLVYMPTL